MKTKTKSRFNPPIKQLLSSQMSSLINLKLIIALLYIPYTPLIANSSIQTDGTTQTKIKTSANGITIIDIANPNANGLSRNKYINYNLN